jgi:hypothetical protein
MVKLGFQLTKGRQETNIGHGDRDTTKLAIVEVMIISAKTDERMEMFFQSLLSG